MTTQTTSVPKSGAGRTLLRLATAGSVDDGKSTLVGRLLFDTNSVLSDTLDHVEQVSRRRGLASADLALLTDGLRAEREQGITIDVAYRYFHTPARKFILADCPGHVQYTRNTVTGSSTADVIVLLVDARNGVVEQTRRHLAVAALLRVPHVVLVINKIDLVDFSEAVFTEIATDFAVLARSFGLPDLHCIPVSATEGDNVAVASSRTEWYDGPTVLGFLESVDVTKIAVGGELRFPVQNVIRTQGAPLAPWAPRPPEVEGDYRGYAGKIESGTVRVGADVIVLPRGSRSRVRAIDTPDGPLEQAIAGQSVIIRLDGDLDISRGDLFVSTEAPPSSSTEVHATVSWLSTRPLAPHSRVLVQHGTSVTRAVVTEIEQVLDLDIAAGELPRWTSAESLGLNDIGRVKITLATPLPIDLYRDYRPTGAFIIVDEDDGWTLGAGMSGPTSLNATVQPDSGIDSSPAAPPVPGVVR